MRALGIEFSSTCMHYVALRVHEGECELIGANRVELGGTRDKGALVAFQDATKTIFNDVSPDVIGIKQKPESGRMSAGAAALKMEGIVIANAPCSVEFVSGHKINQVTFDEFSLYAYQKPALKTAFVVLNTVTV